MNPSSTMFLAKEKIASRSGLPSPRPIDGSSGKVDQASADYRGPDDKCSACRHFDGVDSCSKVDGTIDPDWHSRFFEKAESATPEGQEEGYDVGTDD